MAQSQNSILSLNTKIKTAAFSLRQCHDNIINKILNDIAQSLRQNSSEILTYNDVDVCAARDKRLSPALIDRLMLNAARIDAMAQSVLEIAKLPNPCGQILEEWDRPNGLKLQKIFVPIGVLGMIYESRPNVTIDAAALALKSRNAIILRGGSESFNTSKFLYQIIVDALVKNNVSPNIIYMPPTTDRAVVDDMLNAPEVIDVIIPRGGKGLTKKVMDEAKMPVFAHLDGNCHIYVHPSVNPDMAISVIKNAKLRRTGICGALESLLFDEGMDMNLAKNIIEMLIHEGVEIVGDDKIMAFNQSIKSASEDDWAAEYLDKKISIKFVSNIQTAVEHINHYGSHHTDSILCEDIAAKSYFLDNVDSAIVMHNASTQFADGGEFGFGAEIGIGTGKLHARGPVGLKQLCTFKYIVLGDGQIRP